uniref:Uncharacterized protein n=1 Tax=Cyprinus carpio TaxID=7962 RepID=A0A8C1TZ30_CYPCA
MQASCFEFQLLVQVCTRMWNTHFRQPPSLDKLPEQYLIGQWPREPYQPQASCMSDKATQVSQCHMQKKNLKSWFHLTHNIYHKRKEKKPKRLSASSSNKVLSRPIMCRMPSYSDGVNQELENVFICEEKALEVRDGGRAPVPPLHHTHSAETQISCCSPAADAEKGSARSVPWCCPLCCAVFTVYYRCGSPLPQFSSSPKPNNSYTFKREPPEGCEKVKVFEDLMTQGFPIFSCPDRNKVNFTPSGSAFCPVKLLCSSLFPSDDAARPSSGQTSGSFTELRPVSSERCSIRKCLLLIQHKTQKNYMALFGVV